MLIVNNEQEYKNHSILGYLPRRIRRILYYIDFSGLEEIRLRQGSPVMLYYGDATFFISQKAMLTKNPEQAVCVTKQDITEGIELVCGGSLYAVAHHLRNGFITVDGGHRVGISGTAVLENEKIINLKDICGLNYRMAREIVGISDKLMDAVVLGTQVQNTLLISPPQCGKTTLLRDIVRNLSACGKKLGIADERGEIAAVANGYMGYNLGFSADVLTGAPKDAAMLMLLRSMSPDIIVTDELGSAADAAAVEKIMHAGVKMIATVHSTNRAELAKRRDMQTILEHFECLITLSRRNGVGTVEEIFHAG